nr:unnamed protein product [Callosobruchus chinensis]
MRDSCVAHP